MELARTPNTKEVATRAMKQAQNNFMSGLEAEDEALMREGVEERHYRGLPWSWQCFFGPLQAQAQRAQDWR